MTAALPLDQRVAIITGAGGDIGRAIARRFMESGASVALLDLVDALPGAPDDGGIALVCDVTDADDTNSAVEAVVSRFGRVDILVNNAAAPTPLGTVCDIALADWRQTIDVNLTGAFLMSKWTVPHMQQTGGGVILNIASQLGHVATRGRAAYSASKAGLISLTRTLALDHAGDGIRAVSLSPGAVLTSRITGQAGDAEAALRALGPLHPIGRIGTPQEIAETALFLVSDSAAFMTGSDVLVDGGYTAQ